MICRRHAIELIELETLLRRQNKGFMRWRCNDQQKRLFLLLPRFFGGMSSAANSDLEFIGTSWTFPEGWLMFTVLPWSLFEGKTNMRSVRLFVNGETALMEVDTARPRWGGVNDAAPSSFASLRPCKTWNHRGTGWTASLEQTSSRGSSSNRASYNCGTSESSDLIAAAILKAEVETGHVETRSRHKLGKHNYKKRTALHKNRCQTYKSNKHPNQICKHATSIRIIMIVSNTFTFVRSEVHTTQTTTTCPQSIWKNHVKG